MCTSDPLDVSLNSTSPCVSSKSASCGKKMEPTLDATPMANLLLTVVLVLWPSSLCGCGRSAPSSNQQHLASTWMNLFRLLALRCLSIDYENYLIRVKQEARANPCLSWPIARRRGQEFTCLQAQQNVPLHFPHVYSLFVEDPTGKLLSWCKLDMGKQCLHSFYHEQCHLSLELSAYS